MSVTYDRSVTLNKTDRQDITVILSILISNLESNKSKQSYYARNKVKNKTYHTVEIVQQVNRKIVERSKIDTPNKQFHNRSLAWLGTLVGLY